MMIERINNGSISFLGTHKHGQLQKNNAAGSRNLLDSLTNVSKQRLTFYEANKNNPNLLRDTVNFFDGSVTYGKGSNGFFYMGNDGKGQAIPQNAVSRIDVGSLAKLSAKANTICLSSKSYYAYKGIDGKEYACAFNGKTVCRARSEWMLGRCKENTTPECRGAMVLTMHVLSGLANGSTGVLHTMERATVKDSLANLGIKPGKFTISVDGAEKSYYLTEEGRVYTEKYARDVVDMYNKNTWLSGHSVGDTITVYGRDYPIGEDGHIHVPTEGFWSNEKCTY